ncbi:hypothetical protein AC578_11154 [Pseudocercospora eumusae]|uniref:Uncharacterized protein n=1 Tax=Pseudocercospora eumusae TaxID=321146 RepID=A0A139GY92_9PEZI|nr:hypothetical protein AC578_11154 [Pseudocercospora eumusae]
MATSALAASDSVELFIDNMNPDVQWAASIQNACEGSTTYVISCTSAAMGCGGETATITEGSDFYMATTAAIYSETSAIVTESCRLNNVESSASCIETIVAGQYGNDISKTVSFNLTGTDYYRYQVAITGGTKHTSSGGACLASVSAAQSNLHLWFPDIFILGAVLLLGFGGVMIL